MEIITSIGEFLQRLPEYLGLFSAALVGLIGLFSVIPGEQPEAFMQKTVDFLSKFSRKKK